MPDLVADLPAVSDSNPIVGQAITVDVTVRNQGPGEALYTRLRYYRSDDDTITPGDTQVESTRVAELSPSASSVITITTEAPAEPGTYHFGVCIDPVPLEAETANNCSAAVAIVVERGFTLSGTVRDGRSNGLLLAGATVRLESGQYQTTATTDESGRYSLQTRAGTATVTAKAPRFVAEAVEVAVDADRTVDLALKHGGTFPYLATPSRMPEIIGPDDPTSLQSVTYIGREERRIVDRRHAAWITVNAYVFRARYENADLQFQVNPEFGSVEAARAEVDRYAAALGRLPTVLLSRAQKVTINAGKGFGGSWSSRSFLIHTGLGQDFISNGSIEEVFIHEGGHVSLDGAHKDSAGWRAAQAADGAFISDYARLFPDREDIAESILPYFAVRYFPERLTDADRALILSTIPNRLAYFDEQGFDMSPYTMSAPVSVVVDMSNVEDLFFISGVVSGPNNRRLEGIGIYTWPRTTDNSGFGRTKEDGTFAITVPDGSFSLRVYARGPGCNLIGWYGPGGFTTVEKNATLIEVDGESVEDIVVRLPDHPDALPFVGHCA